MVFHRGAPLTVLALLLTGFAPAVAQFSTLEKVFSKIESVNVFYTFGGFEPRSTVLTTSDPKEAPNQTGLRGFGFEVSIDIGQTNGPALDSATCLARRRRLAPDTIEVVTDYQLSGDSARPVARHIRTKLSARNPCEPRAAVSYELALGYSQLRGFRAQDTTFSLFGSLRELPSAAVYATFNPQAPLNFYVGVRTGLAQLSSLRAYSNDTVYVGAATTFQMGVALGFLAEKDPFELFVEGVYNVRHFPSIEWTPVASAVPERFPRELKMSGWGIAIGFQVNLSEPGNNTEKEKIDQ